MTQDEGMSYAKAGVDRDAEEKSVSAILKIIKTTQKEMSIPEGHYAASVPFGENLISLATDGVGSKVILAQELGKYDTIGIDCVAMNVNDLLAIGSIPYAFVDYIAIRKPDEKLLSEIVKGLAEGCIQSEIPLVGGETAILPEIITSISNEQGFDVAGTALGVHKTNESITGEKISSGDTIIGVSSTGVHSNGFTLARKVMTDSESKKELLIPTRIYVKLIKSLLDSHRERIHGMAHITGGGFTNLLRIGKFHYSIEIDKENIPPIFGNI